VGLVVTGRAPDGIIEAVEAPGERFVVGVQWHPEDMAGHPGIGESADRLFAALADAARSDS
jgi:gamma-glutamyl-gamma-aminobutyrate hydrolase PuuD